MDGYFGLLLLTKGRVYCDHVCDTRGPRGGDDRWRSLPGSRRQLVLLDRENSHFKDD